ncbi:ubiquitin carboxyl-terminal hydrolase 5-like [Littorina saxatilis]
MDPKEMVRPRIRLLDCISSFAAEELVDDFYSSAIQGKTQAKKTTRLASFPDYLFLQLKKFTVDLDWTPKKLDVSIEVPDELDLSALRGKGKQPNEEELPSDQPAQPEIRIDEGMVAQLVDMGFPLEGCRKAVYHTKSQGIEPAMNWVMEHMGDPDFGDPLQLVAKGKTSEFVPNEDALAMISSMGFSRPQAIKALKATDNNVERAADWIFSHTEELDQPEEVPMDTQGAAGQQGMKFRDGSEKYKLVAFISHMGTSTSVGHYVCHILRQGRWVIYNDEKVALSEHPPRDLAYLYLYQRV